jgi:uncharacterized protein (DUF1499 family)
MPFGVLARTAPDAGDPKLRGRTYSIPFHTVWEAALKLAGGGLKRWHVVQEDETDGLIRAEAKTFVRKRVSEIEVRIILDQDAQTRVDMTSERRNGAFDWGANTRHIIRFFTALDRELARPRTERAKSTS